MKRFGIVVRMLVLTAGVALAPSFAMAATPAKPTTSDSKPAATPPKTGPRKAGQAPPQLAEAIAELNKQFSDYLAAPDTSNLSKKSDYFKKLPEDTTVEDIMNVLERGNPGPAAQAAWVKFQLLSGCPSKWDAPMLGRGYSLYVNAPMPQLRFSIDTTVRAQLNLMSHGVKEDGIDSINTPFEAKKKQIDELNGFIFAYRDALYAHLPVTADTLIARLQDGVIRCQVGASPNSLLTAMSSDIRAWTAVDASVQGANAVLVKLGDCKKVKGPAPFKSLAWDDKPPKGAKWTSDEGGKFKAETVAEIEKMLKAYIANPKSTGLKFKDS